MALNHDTIIAASSREPADSRTDPRERAAVCASSRLKRALDIVLASAGLVAISPLLTLIAIVVFLQDRGPVFFRQRRSGLNGKVFWIWKFRTMRQEIGYPFRQTTGKSDPRITPVGRWLRRASLDELPQLFNVMSGDMSLVGPRPHPVELDDRLEPRHPDYKLRWLVRPGITGTAQINGCRGPINTDTELQRRLEHDLGYIRGWSLLSDITILALTVWPWRSNGDAY